MASLSRIEIPKWCVSLLAAALLCGLAVPTRAVPSFARQTGMTCAACHTVFPELTPFGREFKLNGYVLDNIKQVTGIDTSNRSTLALNSIPPISVMLQISYTRTSTALPDSNITGALAKDGDVLFPQQASFFYAGKIADELGAFIQLTYDGAENQLRTRQHRHSLRTSSVVRRRERQRPRPDRGGDAQQQPDGAGRVEHHTCLGISVLGEQRSTRHRSPRQ